MDWNTALLHWMMSHPIIICIGIAWKLLAGLIWFLRKKYNQSWLDTAKLILSSWTVFWIMAGAAVLTATLMFILEMAGSKNLSMTSFAFAIWMFTTSLAIIIYPGLRIAEKRFERA